MKKYLLILLIGIAQMTSAQQTTEVEDEEKGFQKNRLFTGGSVQLSFGTGQFLGGVNPIFGYSITNWLDGGLVLNYTYASQRDYNAARPEDPPYRGRLRQSVYGGGVFTRVFPLRMIFLQAQAEHNFIDLNFKPHIGGEFKSNDDANSLLVGGGYTTGRDPESR